MLLCISVLTREYLPEFFLPWHTHIAKTSSVSLFWWPSPGEKKFPSVLALPQENCHEKPVPSSGTQTEPKRLNIAIDLTEGPLGRTTEFTSWQKEERATSPGIRPSYFFIWPGWIFSAHVTWRHLVLKEWLQRNHLLFIKSSRDSNIISPVVKLWQKPEIV